MSTRPEPKAYDEGSYDPYAHVLYQDVQPTEKLNPSAFHYSNTNTGSDDKPLSHTRKRFPWVTDATGRDDGSPHSSMGRDSSFDNKDAFNPPVGLYTADASPSLNRNLATPGFTPTASQPRRFATPPGLPPTAGSNSRFAAPGAAALPAGVAPSSFSNTAVSSGSRDTSAVPSSQACHYGLVDPNMQLSALYYNDVGDLDDDLHRIGPDDDKRASHGSGLSARGVTNMATMIILILALLMLFAGYPVFTAISSKRDELGGYGPGGTNGTGQISSIPGVRTTLIDPDTPQSAYTRSSGVGKDTMKLVFSDEFNTPGRTFYPGDDAFWEAVDLHYWATNNYEWYDPAAVTTADGALRLTISQHPEHNLNFRGGMIQSWNKFCFTGGVLVAGVRLPGKAKASGLWPAIWLMGNLGRAGYGATLEGTWPYSYDACDIGTLANQTDPATLKPDQSELGNCPFNQKHASKSLSFLPGQRLSACTCPDDDHPGPKLPDGSYPGRMAPEIDLFEAQVNQQEGMTVSQSCQYAPYNAYYRPTAKPMLINKRTIVNSYTGELTQQSMSGVTPTNQQGMQYLHDNSTGIFTDYAVEYQPGHGGYVQWWASGDPAWRLTSDELKADPTSQISERPVPPEPMYIIANVGISQNFGTPAWNKLIWPSSMEIDYIRVYQKGDKPNVGCDPPDFPTSDYINRHQEAYTNPNFTLWGEGGYNHPWPRNRLNPGGCDAAPSNNPGSPTKPVPKSPVIPTGSIGKNQQECQINDWNKGQQQG